MFVITYYLNVGPCTTRRQKIEVIRARVGIRRQGLLVLFICGVVLNTEGFPSPNYSSVGADHPKAEPLQN